MDGLLTDKARCYARVHNGYPHRPFGDLTVCAYPHDDDDGAMCVAVGLAHDPEVWVFPADRLRAWCAAVIEMIDGEA